MNWLIIVFVILSTMGYLSVSTDYTLEIPNNTLEGFDVQAARLGNTYMLL